MPGCALWDSHSTGAQLTTPDTSVPNSRGWAQVKPAAWKTRRPAVRATSGLDLCLTTSPAHLTSDHRKPRRGGAAAAVWNGSRGPGPSKGPGCCQGQEAWAGASLHLVAQKNRK